MKFPIRVFPSPSSLLLEKPQHLIFDKATNLGKPLPEQGAVQTEFWRKGDGGGM